MASSATSSDEYVTCVKAVPFEPGGDLVLIDKGERVHRSQTVVAWYPDHFDRPAHTTDTGGWIDAILSKPDEEITERERCILTAVAIIADADE